MPTNQPSNASGAAAPRDGDTAASVLSDERLDQQPGGGGLRAGGGSAPGEPAPGATPEGPQAPVARPEAEAARQSVETTRSTGGRSSGG